MNAMTRILYQIEQAHADAGQFTDMLTTARQQAGGEPTERTSDPSQRDDPPAKLISAYHAMWMYEAQRRVAAEDSRRGWRALAIALGAALVIVVWMGGMQW